MTTFKRHLVSGLVTFLSTFLVVFASSLTQVPLENIMNFTFFKNGALASLIVVAVRAGIKAGVESFGASGDKNLG